MAIVCKGFDGQMTEADWARMAQLMGGVPTVRDADDLTVSADVQGTTVTAAIIPGVSWAHDGHHPADTEGHPLRLCGVDS